MKLSNKFYDIAKIICLIVIPAVNGFITLLNSLWNWNLPIEAITGSISGFAVLVGSILGFSSAKYNKEMNENE